MKPEPAFSWKKILPALTAAFTFLTYLPLSAKRNHLKNDELPLSLSFYPLVGLFFGLVMYGTAFLFIHLKVSPGLTAWSVIAGGYLINHFLHFDGLADVCDAFLAPGKQQEIRLKILKDPSIGSFALGGMILYIGFKYLILKELIITPFLLPYLILTPLLARYSLVLLAYLGKYPRLSGTAAFIVGKIPRQVLMIATFLTIIFTIGIILIFKMTFLAIVMIAGGFITMILFTALFKIYSNNKIGGVTGDVLGAVNELNELILPFIALIITMIIRK